QALRVRKVLIFWIAEERRVFRYELSLRGIIISGVQILEVCCVIVKLANVFSQLVGARRNIDACRSVWVIVECLHHVVILIGDDIRAPQVIWMYIASLCGAGGYSACLLLVDGRDQAISVEDVIRCGRELRPADS